MWRNEQGFLSQGDVFRLKPLPIELLISSLAMYSWLLHSCACTLPQMPTGGCTWDVTAEGQLSPCHQLQQGRAVSDAQAAYARIWTLLLGKGRGREGQIQPAKRKGKQSERRTGYPGKPQTSYGMVSQGRNTTRLAHCPRHFFQLLWVYYGPKRLPSSAALLLVCFSIAIIKAPNAQSFV